MSEPGSSTIKAGAFRIDQQVLIEASTVRVFDALTRGIPMWWNRAFAEQREVVLEPFVGGRFYEVWGAEQGALFAFVTRIRRGEVLVLSGPLLLQGAVQSVVAIDLKPRGDATLVQLSHHVLGEVDGEIEAFWAREWQDLLGTRLKNFVETGKPE